jgi:ATP-dependent 26S proteasome regulatory subunit
VDSLDSALGGSFEGVSGRPGRIDRSILFSYLDDNGKKFLANRILDDKMKIESVLSVSKDETPAQFRERCYQEVDLPN